MIAVGERLVVDDPSIGGSIEVEVTRVATGLSDHGLEQVESFEIVVLDASVPEPAQWSYHRIHFPFLLIGQECKGGCGTLLPIDPDRPEPAVGHCFSCAAHQVHAIRTARYDAEGESP